MGKEITMHSIIRHVRDYYGIVAFMIMLMSLIMRSMYAIATPYDSRQFDSYAYNADAGHASFAFWMADNFPATPGWNTMDTWSWSNPPLYYWIAALWIKLFRLSGLSDAVIANSLKTLSVVFITMFIIILNRILRMLISNHAIRNVLIAFIAFQPTLVYASAWISPDPLLYVMEGLTILFLLKWWIEPDLANAVSIGIIMGLGMSVKYGYAIYLIIAFIVFIIGSIRHHADVRACGIIIQGAYAGVIASILGFMYPMIQHYQYGLPFLYIQKPAEMFLSGNLWDRLSSFPSLLRPYVCNIDYAGCDYNESNIILGTFKSALFQSFKYDDRIQLMLGTMMFILAVIMIILLFIGIIMSMKTVIRDMIDDDSEIIVFIIAITALIVFHVASCVVAPYPSTFSFRYVFMLALMIPVLSFWKWRDMPSTRDTLMVNLLIGIICCLIIITIAFTGMQIWRSMPPFNETEWYPALNE